VVTVRHRRRCRNGGGRDEAVRGGVGGDERVGADAGGRAAARQRQRFVHDACCMSLFASGRGAYLEAMANRSVSEERSSASQTRCGVS
jgi:hypothetical protein